MRRGIAVLLAVVAMQAACMGVELTQEFKAKEGFTVRLPGDWKPISREVLDKLSTGISKVNPTAGGERLDYGFQLSPVQDGVESPFLIVQVKRTGKIPEDEFRSTKREQAALEEEIEKAKKAMSSAAIDAHLGEVRYDAERHILWAPIAIQGAPSGDVKGLAATLLTEEGAIILVGYAKAEDFEQYGPVFEEIAKRVTLREDLRYKPRAASAKLTLWQTAALANLGLLAGAVAYVAILTRKNKATAKRTAWIAWGVLTVVTFFAMGEGLIRAMTKSSLAQGVGMAVFGLVWWGVITGVPMVFAAGWRPWRRTKALEGQEPPVLP